MNYSDNNKRIAKNTVFLYLRMFFSLVVSFFTAGIVLNVLGVTDYGIYNVVGGLVTMFSIVSNSLSAASSRYITFELGKKDGETNAVFNASLQIHIFLAIIIIILLETVGLWFLCNKMTIPPERLNAAIIVFQFSTISFGINLLSVTYNADIIAHEHMDAYAYISIIDIVLRLIILFLLRIGDFDRLIFYGLLQMIVSIILQTIYVVYCRKNFSETKLHFTFNRKLITSMIGFSGWNFIGASATLLKNQGVDIIINIFLGPAANAAKGIGSRVNSMISSFGNNLLAAINPQITKSFADDNIEYSFALVNKAARFGFMLLFFISFPVLVRTDTLLTIWLKNVPEHATSLSQLSIICSLIDILSVSLITLMLATGRIKWYQITVGGVMLLNLPISYVALQNGLPIESTMVIAAMIGILCLILRLVMLNRMIKFNIKTFFTDVIIRVALVSTMAIGFYYLTCRFFNHEILQSLIYISICGIYNTIIIFYLGIKETERKILLSFIRTKIMTICVKRK